MYVGQQRCAAGRLRENGPRECQQVTIGIAGTASIQRYQAAALHALSCTGLATGIELMVEIITVAGWLFTIPSFTISWMT